MRIAPNLPDIIKLVGSHPVSLIVAPTGSGKSVGVPAAVAATGVKCFVTVPTRTAAISLAEYQRMLQSAANPNVDVGTYVGHAAEGNISYNDETYIAYVTGGHARRKMLSYFSGGIARPIDFCDVLMVDEVHSGTLDTTTIISLWMTAADAGVTVPRLIIASATPVPMHITPEPAVFTLELETYPITYHYLKKPINSKDPGSTVYRDTAIKIADIHRESPIDSGHILAFAPGASEVEAITNELWELLKVPVDGKTHVVIPAFGALRQEDIQLIYSDVSPCERKIIIATNIAEMSITIEDVGHVFDTMLEKRAETSQSGGFRLSTHLISKDSAIQRAGRTGRTRPGHCYRMVTIDQFNGLEEHRPPEIDRVPIYETIMELLDVGLSPSSVLRGISNVRVSTAIHLLTKLHMVKRVKSGVVVTDRGHFAPNFPLSVRNAAFLWEWIQQGHPIFPGIVVSSLIDCYGPSYYWIPRRNHNEGPEEYNHKVIEYKHEHFDQFIGNNDLETALNMWNNVTNYLGGINGSPRAISKWSNDNSINNKKLQELLTVIGRSVNVVERLNMDITIGPFTTNGVMNAARPILLSIYSDNVLIHRRNTTYMNPLTKEEFRLDSRDSVSNLINNAPLGIIALSTAEILTQNGTFRVIGFGVDTKLDGLGRTITINHRTSPRRSENTIMRQPPIQNEKIKSAINLLKNHL